MATSTSFVADLPPMDADQLAKMYTWGKTSCNRFDVHMKQDGFTLVVERKKDGTVREHQRMLRTNLKNWGVDMPEKMKDWLRIVSDADQLPAPAEQEDSGRAAAREETHAREATSTDMLPPPILAKLRLREPLNLLANRCSDYISAH